MNLAPERLYNKPVALILTLGAIWFVVLINLRGVKAAGIFAEVTTYTKLVPFAAIALVGLFYVRSENLSEFNPSGESLLDRVRGARAAHDVRLPRPRVGDGAGRRRARP
mgnify:CR=1 FL=1